MRKQGEEKSLGQRDIINAVHRGIDSLSRKYRIPQNASREKTAHNRVFDTQDVGGGGLTGRSFGGEGRYTTVLKL